MAHISVYTSTEEEIQTLVSQIVTHEYHYRIGDPLISDDEFDKLKERLHVLAPDHNILTSIVGESFLGKKVALPRPMGSLINIKKEEQLKSFIDNDVIYIITPKFDGISATRLSNGSFISRGDKGTEGTDITKYCKYFDTIHHSCEHDVRGEIVVSRKNFMKINDMRLASDLEPYKSERSAVIGLMQSDKPDVQCLRLLEFIPYTLYKEDMDKSLQLLTILHYSMGKSCPFIELTGSEINVGYLSSLFKEFSIDYAIDGLVIDVDSHKIVSKLGFETNSFNPKYARAYKIGIEDEADTVVTNIIRQVSKSGRLAPVIEIEPVVLCGDTITRINADNERFLLWYGVGIGSEITLKKSGNVIPRMTKVDDAPILPFDEFNKKVKYHGEENVHSFQEYYGFANNYIKPTIPYKWCENNVHIYTTSTAYSDLINKKRIEYFFDILRILNIGGSSISILYDNGFDDVPKILLASESELIELPNFGKKKIENIRAEVIKRLSQSSLELIMQASGYFSGVGETKLKLLNISLNQTLLYDELIKINGIGETMATIIVNGLSDFWEFYSKISILIQPKQETKSGFLSNEIVCFTGFRDKDLVEKILENGGEYKESINKTITMLVYDDKNGRTGKIDKAEKDGTRIITKIDFYKMFEKDETSVSFGSLF